MHRKIVIIFLAVIPFNNIRSFASELAKQGLRVCDCPHSNVTMKGNKKVYV